MSVAIVAIVFDLGGYGRRIPRPVTVMLAAFAIRVISDWRLREFHVGAACYFRRRRLGRIFTDPSIRGKAIWLPQSNFSQSPGKSGRRVLRFGCVVILAVVGLFPAAVSAFQLDGNQLLELCSGQSQICAGYVMGVADARDRDPHGIAFCIPPGVSNAQLQEVVVKSLRNSPKRTFPASIMVSAAFAEKFHCSN